MYFPSNITTVYYYYHYNGLSVVAVINGCEYLLTVHGLRKDSGMYVLK